MDKIWKNILKHQGETFYTKTKIAFTYSLHMNGSIYIDTVKSYALTPKNFNKALQIGKRDRLAEYEGIIAKSHIYAILNDSRIGAW
jgi:hypothetical protein